MNVEFDFPTGEARIVYVRPVSADELPDALQEDLDPGHPIYAIHAPDGARLALARDRAIAFALARGHDCQPVSVH